MADSSPPPLSPSAAVTIDSPLINCPPASAFTISCDSSGASDAESGCRESESLVKHTTHANPSPASAVLPQSKPDPPNPVKDRAELHQQRLTCLSNDGPFQSKLSSCFHVGTVFWRCVLALHAAAVAVVLCVGALPACLVALVVDVCSMAACVERCRTALANKDLDVYEIEKSVEVCCRRGAIHVHHNAMSFVFKGREYVSNATAIYMPTFHASRSCFPVPPLCFASEAAG
jgi:hypothetical protein